MNRRIFSSLLFTAVCCAARRGLAGEAESGGSSPGRPNAVLPTMGGRQFWADEQFFHGWHIQRNSFTGHYRLLDDGNKRHAWGTLADCQAKLMEIRRRDRLQPMRGQAVVVLHGLGRSAGSMGKMAQFLRTSGKYSVFNVSYPTTRGSISDHAQTLARVVGSLDGIETIHFVAHSLGNLVIRHYLADTTDAATGKRPDPRIKRIVMLGPPNNGARLAEVFVRGGMIESLVGKAAAEIRDFPDVADHLATPACEFAIIAGGRGEPRGYNPWLSGDNDLVVSVETTRLPGAADFALLPVLHTLMMDDPVVQDYTLRFLNEGYFVSAAKRQPIERPPELPAERLVERPADGPPQ